MKVSSVLAVAAVFTLFGCAHSMMRGSVAMKVNDEQAHVCLGDNEVVAGDKVALYKNDCRGVLTGAKAGPGGTCEKVKLGEGVVSRTLNSHYSVVKVNPGVQFEEGTIVEKE